MKVIILKNDDTVFSSYTEKDVEAEMQEEIDHSGAEYSYGVEEIHEELKSWVTTDMDTLRKLQEKE